MKIMVIGGGGREHAIIRKLKESPLAGEIYALPGNGGIASDAICVPIGAKEIDKIVAFAKEKAIEYAVVAPDDPLVLGAVDALEAAGIPCFGPNAAAAQIEGSKVFSKNLMKKYGIPTAAFEVFTELDAALAYLKTAPLPTVIKADGLALGKGVVIAETREEAESAVIGMMRDGMFGKSGSRVVIEEYLTGPEVSVLSFTDGKTVVPMVSSMDHKRALDGDKGLNTGGMGTVAPNPYYTGEIAERCMREIFLPTVAAMQAEGAPFKGCLYFGLMLTPNGPKVIEYNCRFGDPETQVVLPLLESDLLTIMRATTDGTLTPEMVRFSDGAACCVVMASNGYPAAYESGYPITLDENAKGTVYYAGAKLDENGTLLSAGGRVLGAVATAPTLSDAVKDAYALSDKIHFANAYRRSDIGARALAAKSEVYRIFVEKKPELANEANALCSDIVSLLGIKGLTGLRILNRYDVEDISHELFLRSVDTVFSEPQLDLVSDVVDTEGYTAFAVEYLPGQFDQRADSAAQCIQILSCGNRPLVRGAKVYLLKGELSESEINQIKKYVINPVESREASMEKPETLVMDYAVPEDVAVLSGFCEMKDSELSSEIARYGLAMDEDDLAFCRDYFRSEKRDPTITELRMIDTYWSDHCRHTTFLTTIDSVRFDDPLAERAYESYLESRRALGRTKPINLMDVATMAVRYLKATGKLPRLDESEEINACTVKITVTVDGEEQEWLLLFKNETHNHPTEIEPFGGAATCIGGAIRDPLSGRSYVYAAMRVTGAADPLRPVSETLAGKLPQRKIVTTAAAGYSSYGNQIGLATGLVDEIYHEGYAAKRLEIGAVVAAAPAENVRRERPDPDDVVILLGGRTGRDGCGGATGSSKSHTEGSLSSCGAEVQKGNAPEERKLQRLFRSPEASRLIKRCNDFGAGGVSVAVGELADGLYINLDKVPKKYEGLDGTELAISESQERMAVVVAPEDVARFTELADAENLEATVIATVTAAPRLVMQWRGRTIVDLSREFLNSNGAEKHVSAEVASPRPIAKKIPQGFALGMKELASDLNVCSKRGLSERFDSTIGAGTVLMPFGGKNQLTPIQAMVQKISVEKGHTNDCSVMAYGYNPFVTEADPFRGAYLAVFESVAKLVAAGADLTDTYLTFQEYFEKPRREAKRFGKPLAALLGAYRAQMELGIASIGGKDSMSGSFEKLDVPPTLVSFAVTTAKVDEIVSPELKGAGHKLVLVSPENGEDGLPTAASFRETADRVAALVRSGKVHSIWTPTYGGVAEGLIKCTIGNGVGVRLADTVSLDTLFGYRYASFVLELDHGAPLDGILLGETVSEDAILYKGEVLKLDELLSVYEGKLESVYPTLAGKSKGVLESLASNAAPSAPAKLGIARPRVLIPVFPGTNCEYDTAKAFADAGADPEIFVIKNLTAKGIAESVEAFARKVKESQIVFIPGGFSGGDEPDGSGKFITAFFRSGAVKDEVNTLLKCRDGLLAGICNGFQAIIKLGLVPYGEIRDTKASDPTLTFNTIGRHQSRIVHTAVASVKSPWLSACKVGDVFKVPISHGEGRFLADEATVRALAANGQIATQYVDVAGNPTDDILFNPNGSTFAIEGITSPDGRVLGKMGHSERKGYGLYKNVPGEIDMKLFESATLYFK